LFAKRDTPDCAGVALLLSAQPGPRAKGSIQLRTTRAPAAVMVDPALEQLRQQVPAMRALPFLQRLARGESGAVVLDYLAPQQIELDVTPC
jgi:hypothetical protein